MRYDQPALSDPIASALGWISGSLLGAVAITIAIVAVAAIGLMMLAGRIEVRRAMQVILGCFIVFGASTIAAGIQAAILGHASAVQSENINLPPYYPPAAPPPPRSVPAVTDPYAGAAVPSR